MHVDVNFGDPIVPSPAATDLPLLLGGTLTLQAYPDHMVLAEKIVTALERGEANTRWRDFVDVTTIIRSRPVMGDRLAESVETVARHRGVAVQPLRPTLAAMPALAQRKWSVWRRKQRLTEATPEDFSALLETYLRFAEPVLAGRVMGRIWDPSTATW